jgi:hypothetical protein
LGEEERIKQLQALCREAELLKRAAEALCKDLTQQIERSKRLITAKRPPFPERRKRPR